MPETLTLEVAVHAAEDTTSAEAWAATQRVAELLMERPEVQTIAPVREMAPEGAKSAMDMAGLGALLVQVAPAFIQPLIGMIRELLTRPGTTPTKVSVKTEGKEVSVEFDPRHATEDDIATLTKKLTEAL